jgi:hypothetical protein
VASKSLAEVLSMYLPAVHYLRAAKLLLRGPLRVSTQTAPVNGYPQECENLLITHPLVADAAVFGVPNEDLGEEIKAVVQPMPTVAADDSFARSLRPSTDRGRADSPRLSGTRRCGAVRRCPTAGEVWQCHDRRGWPNI